MIDLLSDLTHSRIDLIVENALLRQQLIILRRQVKRPQFCNSDRIRLVLLSNFTKFWKPTLHIIHPIAFDVTAGVMRKIGESTDSEKHSSSLENIQTSSSG